MIDQFSDRLRALRSERGYSLRGLAKLVGVTANAVLRWEKAEVTPTRDKMMELAATFQVEPGWLAWGIGDRDRHISVESVHMRLEHCSHMELKAVSSLLDLFSVQRELTGRKTRGRQARSGRGVLKKAQ